MIVRHAFNPPHNQRLANLCGPLDEHLSAIGMSLGVRIGHRGEHFHQREAAALSGRAAHQRSVCMPSKIFVRPAMGSHNTV